MGIVRDKPAGTGSGKLREKGQLDPSACRSHSVVRRGYQFWLQLARSFHYTQPSALTPFKLLLSVKKIFTPLRHYGAALKLWFHHRWLHRWVELWLESKRSIN